MKPSPLSRSGWGNRLVVTLTVSAMMLSGAYVSAHGAEREGAAEEPVAELPQSMPDVTEESPEPGADDRPMSGDHGQAAQDFGEAPDAQEDLEDSADRLKVEGYVVSVIIDAGGQNAPGSKSATTTDESEERTWLVTDEGAFVALEPEAISEEIPIESGQLLSAEVVIPEEAPDLSLDQSSKAEDLEVVLDWADAAGTVLALENVEVLAVPSGSQSVLKARPETKRHTVEVALLNTGHGTPGQIAIRHVMGRAFDYWKSQTDGVVMGVNPAFTIKEVSTNAATACKYKDAWTVGAAAFGKTPADYGFGSTNRNNAHHLITFANDPACLGISGNAAGVASVGSSVDNGGAIWVYSSFSDLGQIDGVPPPQSLVTLSHEIGHNLGLAHGNQRVCAAAFNDASVADMLANSGRCNDVEYGDFLNIMGATSTLMALPVSMRYELGVAASGSVQEVQYGGSSTVTVTLNPLTASSGVRGLRVISPAPGEDFYVEYRTDSPWSPSGPGIVRVLKTLPGPNNSVSSAWIGTRNVGGALDWNLDAGESITPYGDTVTLSVGSLTQNEATVTLKFTPPVVTYSWVMRDGDWYYQGSDGSVKTGWLNDGAWYFLQANGKMQTGWGKVGASWYYFTPSGAMVTGWTLIGGKWYYLTLGSGAMATGWTLIGGKWYYLTPGSGAMVTGWAAVGGKWYYLDSSGVMLTGRHLIGGKYYSFASNGALIT